MSIGAGCRGEGPLTSPALKIRRVVTATHSRFRRVSQNIPVNHSAAFVPVIQPTPDTGIQALIVAPIV